MTFQFLDQKFDVPDAQWPLVRDAANMAWGYSAYLAGDGTPPDKPMTPDEFCLAQFKTFFSNAVLNGVAIQAQAAGDAATKKARDSLAQLLN